MACDTFIGFIFLLIYLFIIGAFNGNIQTSSIGFASIFPYDFVPYFWTGAGIAEIMINLLRQACLLIFGDNEKGLVIGTCLYFIAAGLLVLCCIFTHLKFVKTELVEEFLFPLQEPKLIKRSSSIIEDSKSGVL